MDPKGISGAIFRWPTQDAAKKDKEVACTGRSVQGSVFSAEAQAWRTVCVGFYAHE